MSRKYEHDIDEDLEEWEPFLHHRNRAHRKGEGERRHFEIDESVSHSDKKRHKERRRPTDFE